MFFQGCSDAFGKELIVQSSQKSVRIRNVAIEYGFGLLSFYITMHSGRQWILHVRQSERPPAQQRLLVIHNLTSHAQEWLLRHCHTQSIARQASTRLPSAWLGVTWDMSNCELNFAPSKKSTSRYTAGTTWRSDSKIASMIPGLSFPVLVLPLRTSPNTTRKAKIHHSQKMIPLQKIGPHNFHNARRPSHSESEDGFTC